MIRYAFVLALVAGAIAACGDGGRETAVEGQEGNEVRVGDLSFRVVSFRELNPAVVADRALTGSAVPAARHGLYAAFITVCNRGEEPISPSATSRLQDAFGSNYAPLREGLDRTLLYTPERLGADECTPQEGSMAERTFDGAALVFEVPFDVTQNRPLVLAIRLPSGEAARVELDL